MSHLLEELMKDAGGFLQNVSDRVSAIAMSADNAEINGVLSYPLQSKGHMFRPYLVYLTYSAHREQRGEPPLDKLVTLAAVVELIHTASLIHDDLIDGTQLRRGMLSHFRKHGMNNAILTGNCYYIRALQMSNDELGCDITREVLNTAYGMCTGELVQAQYEALTIPDDVYLEIIRAKTAGLTALACKGAALVMESGDAHMWETIGEKIGLIYQLKDDVRDQDAHLRSGFNFETLITRLTRELEALLDKTILSDKSAEFSDLIRLF